MQSYAAEADTWVGKFRKVPVIAPIKWLFDTTWVDTERRENHGLPWGPDELQKLAHFFNEGRCLAQMCYYLQRPKAGVLPKLIHLKLVSLGQDGLYYVNPCPETQPTKEVMNQESNTPIATIETKTFIYGLDAANLSDTQIFAYIGKLERSAKQWDGIENKPKKLGAMIEKIKEDAAALVAYVDGR